MARSPKSFNEIAGRSIERINALSDGVFAIAMTLLVLDLRLPAGEAIHSEAGLLRTLVVLSPKFGMYLMSFLTLGIFWAGQQTQLNQFSQTDRHLTWFHIGFLAAVALMPFSTMLLAEHIELRTALLFYWLNIVAMGAFLVLAWRYAKRAGLFKKEVATALRAAVERRMLVAQALYAFGAALCIFSTYLSVAFIVLVQFNFAVAPKLPWLSRQ